MRKGIMFMWLVLLLSGALSSCALFYGKVKVSVEGTSDQTAGTLSVQPLAAMVIASNELAFSPATFKVKIIKVEIVKGVTDPNWTVLYENGNTMQDIVQGAVLNSGSEQEILGGDYNGVRLTYDPNWIVTANVTTNDLPSITSNMTYMATNSGSSATKVLYFATASLKDQVISQGLASADDINVLTAPITLDGSKDSVTLNLIFKTKNMIRVWTNGAGDVTNEPSYMVPDLTINVK